MEQRRAANGGQLRCEYCAKTVWLIYHYDEENQGRGDQATGDQTTSCPPRWAGQMTQQPLRGVPALQPLQGQSVPSEYAAASASVAQTGRTAHADASAPHTARAHTKARPAALLSVSLAPCQPASLASLSVRAHVSSCTRCMSSPVPCCCALQYPPPTQRMADFYRSQLYAPPAVATSGYAQAAYPTPPQHNNQPVYNTQPRYVSSTARVMRDVPQPPQPPQTFHFSGLAYVAPH